MSKNNLTLTNDSGDLLVNYKKFLPCGSIVNYAGLTAPSGWLICDGTELSISMYPDLFNIIGYTYGNDTSGYFCLPDLQERVPVGKTSNTTLGAIGGNTDISLNVSQMPSHNHSGTVDASGAHTHTGTTDSNGTHNHTASDSGHTHTYDDAYFAENLGGGTNNVFGTSASTDGDNSYRYRPTPTTSTGYANITVNNNGSHTHSLSINEAGSHTHTFTTGSSGSGQTIDIRNKFIVLNYIIKY